MEENSKKELIKKAFTEIECVPVFNSAERKKNQTKIPFEQIATIGIAFKPLVAALQKVANQGGGEGMYMVKFPANAKNGTLMKFKDKDAYFGGIKVPGKDGIGAQPELRELPCDPTMLCMAAVMFSVNKKLDFISFQK